MATELIGYIKAESIYPSPMWWSGIGIWEEELGEYFRRFYRVDNQVKSMVEK